MQPLRRVGLVFALSGLAIVLGVTSAEARPLYKTVWERTYEVSSQRIDCALCHPGKSKADRNQYGQALADELGEKNVKDETKIEEAIRRIGKPRKSSRSLSLPKR